MKPFKSLVALLGSLLASGTVTATNLQPDSLEIKYKENWQEVGTYVGSTWQLVNTHVSNTLIFKPNDRFVLIASDVNIPLHVQDLDYSKSVADVHLPSIKDTKTVSSSSDSEFSSALSFNYQLIKGDFDGDGSSDLIIQPVNGDVIPGIAILFGNKNSQLPAKMDTYVKILGFDLSSTETKITVEDFDGDGVSDLRLEGLTGARAGQIAYAHNLGGSFETKGIPSDFQFDATKPNSGTRTPGKVSGLFRVTEQGSVSYNLSFYTPKGAGNFQPQLGLAYNSNSGAGVAGIGWNTTGVQSISRCRKTMETDGENGAIELSPISDRYCLNGQRLLLKSGNNYTSGSAEFRTEIESFSKITGSANINGKGFSVFTVKTKDSKTYSFSANKTSTSGHILSWKLDSVTDQFSNLINYTYNLSGTYEGTLKEVTYSGHKIAYTYTESDNDQATGWAFGRFSSRKSLLQDVKVYQAGTLVRKYGFSYGKSHTSGRSQLNYIEECAYGNGILCYEPTKFDWSQGKLNAQHRVTRTATDQTADVRPTDFNGDGILDLISKKGDHLYLSLGSNSNFGSSFGSREIIQNVENSWWALDVDGDGRQDILEATSGTNTKWRWRPNDFNFEGSVTPDNSLNLIHYLSSKPNHVGFSDFNGDGYTDLLFYDDTGSGKVLIHKHLARKVVQKNIPTELGDLTAFEVWEDKVERILPNIPDSEFNKHPNDSSVVYDSKNEFQTADVNGDGIPDIIRKMGMTGSYSETDNDCIRRREENCTQHYTPNYGDYWQILKGVYSSTQGLRFEHLASFKYTSVIGGFNDGIHEFVFVDVNGDGYQDILHTSKENGNVAIKKFNGVSFESSVAIPSSAHHDVKKYVVFDYNEDGRADLYDGNGTLLLANKVGNYYSYDATTLFPNNTADSKQLAFDVNGDGRSDFIHIDPSASTKFDVRYLGVNNSTELNNALSSSADKITAIKVPNGVDTFIDYHSMAGKAVVYQQDYDAAGKLWGRGSPVFDVMSTAYVVSKVTNTSGSVTDPNNTFGTRYFYQGAKAQAGGRGFLGYRIISSYNEATQVRTTTEFAQQFPYTGMPVATASVWIKDGIDISGVPTEEVTETSYITEVGYEGDKWNLTETPVTRTYQKPTVTLGEYNAAHLTCDQSTLTAGHYLIACGNNDLDFGATIATWEGETPLYPYTKTSKTTAFSLFNDGATWTSYKTSEVDTVNTMTASGSSFYGSISKQEVTTKEYSPESQTNPVATYVVTTDNEFNRDNVSNWQIGRPSKITVTTTRSNAVDESANHVESSEFWYDATTGAVDYSVKNGTTNEFYIKTDYTYDTFGNKIKVTKESKSTLAPDSIYKFRRVARTEYDANGIYVTKNYEYNTEHETSGLGREVSDIQTRNTLGQATYIEDANDLGVTKTYDAFGREVSTTNHLGLSSTTTRGFCSTESCPTTAVYWVQTVADGAPTTKSYIDKYGQTIRTQSTAFDGEVVYSDAEYDTQGRKVFTALPIKSSSTPNYLQEQYGVTTNYDVLGRVSTVVKDLSETETATVTYQYRGNAVLATNALNQKKLTIQNALGDDTCVIEFGTGTSGWTCAGGEAKITYAYDHAGNFTRMIDKAGNTTNIRYDLVGNKTSLSDPVKGDWTYSHNALGALLSQINANSDTTTITYDDLGRKLRRIDKVNGVTVESDTSWTYDISAVSNNWIGALHQVEETVSGHKEVMEYNTLGQLEYKTTTIDTVDYLERFAYDTFGRLESHFDATGSNLRGHSIESLTDRPGTKRTYNSLGFLTKIEDTNQAITSDYYTVNKVDKFGNVTEYTYGNTVKTITSYDAFTGRVDSVKSGKNSANDEITSYDFLFDKLGNLKVRVDNALNFKESYSYDQFNRLNWARTQNNVALTHESIVEHSDYSLSMTYKTDGTGNIDSKTGIKTWTGNVNAWNETTTTGSYHYTKAHQLAQVKNADNKLIRDYSYDSNGNRISETEIRYDEATNAHSSTMRTTEYTVFDKPTLITKTANGVSNTAAFVYGAHRGRIKQTSVTDGKTTETIYLSGVEKVKEGTDAAYYKRFIGGNVIVTTGGSKAGTKYLHKDNQGTIVAFSDESGNLVQRMSFNAYGERRDVYYNNVTLEAGMSLRDIFEVTASSNIDEFYDTHGYTGHEHLDGVGIIHMNGRIYDAETAVFMSADPNIQAPTLSLSLNRYSYVMNNPLAYTDPSGYLWKPLDDALKWVDDNKTTIIAVAGTLTGNPGYAMILNGIIMGDQVRQGKMNVGMAFVNTMVSYMGDGYGLGDITGTGWDAVWQGAWKGAITGGLNSGISAVIINGSPNIQMGNVAHQNPWGVFRDGFVSGARSGTVSGVFNGYVEGNKNQARIDRDRELLKYLAKYGIADASGATPEQNGVAISKAEYALLMNGDFLGFWRSRHESGDPVARTALTGWGDPDFVDASAFEKFAANHTWGDLSSYISDNDLSVTMKQIGLELAVAHAEAVMGDSSGVHKLLSPQQVADYHHSVFANHSIPAHIFGGTHQIGGHWYMPSVNTPVSGGWGPTMFSADTYSWLWCKGCDSTP